jgi:hypothetical protein
VRGLSDCDIVRRFPFEDNVAAMYFGRECVTCDNSQFFNPRLGDLFCCMSWETLLLLLFTFSEKVHPINIEKGRSEIT